MFQDVMRDLLPRKGDDVPLAAPLASLRPG